MQCLNLQNKSTITHLLFRLFVKPFPFYFLVFLFIFAQFTLSAQFISHGPVVGALTDTSARVYIRTHQAQGFVVEYSIDSLFTNFQTSADSTKANLDSTCIFTLANLQPDMTYFLRFRFEEQYDNRSGSFKTFPTVGTRSYLKFTTGSCQETANMKVFDVMKAHKPNLFIHTGDYTYPSYQIDDSYPINYSSVQLSWRRRYDENRTREMLWSVPIDYINDDDDGWGSAKYVNCRSYYDSINGRLVNFILTDSIPTLHRTNVKKAYVEYFPGYALPDTSVALYHSFKAGNCEFFFLDTRNDKDGEAEAFVYNADSNLWSFQPDTGHRIISQTQMDWLKNGLSNSTADWKFIVGGVPFNKSMRRLIEVGIRLQPYSFQLSSQGINSTGMHLALAFGGYWPGYPTSQNELLAFLDNNQIKDVLFISGDTHHNVMDDGQNGGIPEINASGLSVTNTSLAYYLNLYAPVFGEPAIKDSLWNQGGNGLENMNFKNAFGEIEVFGGDSVQLCVIDEDEVALSCFSVTNSRILGSKPLVEQSEAEMNVFPIPNLDKLFVEIPANYDLKSTVQVEIFDMLGNTVLKGVDKSGLLMFSSESLAPGYYLLHASCNGKVWTRKFVKE